MGRASDAILWGVRDDLMIALDRGSDRLIILSNNQEAVQAIQGSSTKASNSALRIQQEGR
ncbi:hypothetical protein J1N35_023106 [Gossypium stocksii]|uniref:Uncharacterized protein n=1 Tax=Gossypium stocksii TaxID=47602 RepID=A0A9D3VHA1_9ROSI|nr:hypothetical protein J1N35_023106 [Gossypium stocksii]